MKVIAALFASVLLLLTAACGGADGGSGASENANETTATASEPVLHDASEIVEHLGMTGDDIAYTYTSDDGQECNVAVVLTSASDVQTYEGAGDVVAKNPDGTVGVKIVDEEEKTCKAKITKALEGFK